MHKDRTLWKNLNENIEMASKNVKIAKQTCWFIRQVRQSTRTVVNTLWLITLDVEDDLKSTSSEQNNKRLAFVHYVYPRTSQKSHFKQFEEKRNT